MEPPDDFYPDSTVIEWLVLVCRARVSTQSQKLIDSLRNVRSQLQTNSQFYHIVDTKDLILLIGQWSSVEAHEKFLDSPERNAVLAEQEKLTSVLENGHLKGRLVNIPYNCELLTMSRLPYGNLEERDLFHSYIKKALAKFPYEVTGWYAEDAIRSKHDVNELKGNESIVFIGWDVMLGIHQFYAALKEYKDFSEHPAFKMFWESMYICQNLESLVENR